MIELGHQKLLVAFSRLPVRYVEQRSQDARELRLHHS